MISLFPSCGVENLNLHSSIYRSVYLEHSDDSQSADRNIHRTSFTVASMDRGDASLAIMPLYGGLAEHQSEDCGGLNKHHPNVLENAICCKDTISSQFLLRGNNTFSSYLSPELETNTEEGLHASRCRHMCDMMRLLLMCDMMRFHLSRMWWVERVPIIHPKTKPI